MRLFETVCCDNYTLTASTYTLFAADAGSGILHSRVFVPKDGHLAENVLGTGIHAVPAGFAVMQIRQNDKFSLFHSSY